jgi:hypothetical protein
MSKKVNMRGWAENTSVTDNVQNYQSKMNRGSSGGKVYADAPPSNRKERRILAKHERSKKNGNV